MELAGNGKTLTYCSAAKCRPTSCPLRRRSRKPWRHKALLTQSLLACTRTTV
ncbi:Hypothetical protein I596_2779 [Dokdonella koreensis DS-123]|uniref:Uncharacterized protein n=1 Tax=Dokdonella koreensis DS-123 TaxID=1300342 RepID=A0A160DWH7_9GAMM|nr:Hypothetical protein I596_2779 [Dokdonella koreensis DS-123]